MTFWKALERAIHDGKRAALATVVDAAGSTPRHRGARMAILAEGGQLGTIGGGRIEHEVSAIALEVARGAPPQRLQRHLVRDLAMCCGGSMDVVVAPTEPSRATLAELTRRAANRRPMVLETPLDGSALVVRPPTDDELVSLRRPRLAADRVLELVAPTKRVVVFGCGHVGQAIGALARSCDFEVVVCDDNEAGAVDAVPSWAHQVVDSFDVATVDRTLGGLASDDYVLIVTRDHAIDQRLVEELLMDPRLGYLGMIGSRGKVGRFKKRLAAKGIGDDAAWQRLHAPIGLSIGAETPEEIAVAVVGELIAHRHRRDAASEEEAPGG